MVKQRRKMVPYLLEWHRKFKISCSMEVKVTSRNIFPPEKYDPAMLQENLSSGFPTRSDTNQAVQPQKMARGLKFQIQEQD